MSAEPPELGPTRRGPEFEPPPTGGQPYGSPFPGAPGFPGGPGQPGPGSVPGSGPGQGQPPAQPPQPQRPPTNRWPTVITIAVIALVAIIVAVATLRSGEPSVVRETAPASPTPSSSAAPSDSPNSIAFSSSEGSGRLTLVSHRWTSQGSDAPTNGSYLQIEVQIEATDGRLSFGPQYFQAFDANSELYQSTAAGARPPLLGNGYLRAGESVTGSIAFDMPRGEVTLLMSNAMMESVTALRIVS